MTGLIPALLVVLAIDLLALGVGEAMRRWVLSCDTGTPEMRRISDAIKNGAEAFMRRQYRTIVALASLSALLIFALLYVFAGKNAGDHSSTVSAAWTTLSFILGAACSVAAGYIGMLTSIHSNIRTASAVRSSIDKAVQVALRGGAVTGIFVSALSILGIGGLVAVLLKTGYDFSRIPFIIVGFGFGASFVALFAQLGGGIYTKAADVGADLVGKVEAGIPEDDPRNPAVIADLVGDNVGDCAGRGADIFESTSAENIGAMILGVSLMPHFGWKGMIFPLVNGAFGLVSSILGLFVVKAEEEGDPLKALNRGYHAATILSAGGFLLSSWWLLDSKLVSGAWIYFAFCGLIGLLTAEAFVYITQYYTAYAYRPVLSIAESCETGAATDIITGMSVGLECTALPVLVISAAIYAAYHLGSAALHGEPVSGLFGIAVATMGMLGTAPYILAMDTFGPITDNAGGIVEMSKQDPSIRRKTDRLDSAGNSTKALTKGYAIGSAALAAFLLFSAYLDEVARTSGKIMGVNLAKPEVFIGAILGAMIVFLFSALAMRAVGRAAQAVISEVRRQFREKPGIMKGTESPDYGQCVDIVTLGALKAMVAPGLVAVAGPVLLGLLFRVFIKPQDPTLAAESVAGMLMVGTIAGILLALVLNNTGGAWDNAKKYIETGAHGGKGSEAHKAAVVGDTVGDPFKDTVGPSLHVLIKLLSTITLVLAPLFL